MMTYDYRILCNSISIRWISLWIKILFFFTLLRSLISFFNHSMMVCRSYYSRVELLIRSEFEIELICVDTNDSWSTFMLEIISSWEVVNSLILPRTSVPIWKNCPVSLWIAPFVSWNGVYVNVAQETFIKLVCVSVKHILKLAGFCWASFKFSILS